MKQFITSFFVATLIVSGNITLTSCTGTMEDIADGLVNGIADQIVDSDGTKRQEEKRKQERLDNLLNWNLGTEVDQEAKIVKRDLRGVACDGRGGRCGDCRWGR